MVVVQINLQVFNGKIQIICHIILDFNINFGTDTLFENLAE